MRLEALASFLFSRHAGIQSTSYICNAKKSRMGFSEKQFKEDFYVGE